MTTNTKTLLELQILYFAGETLFYRYYKLIQLRTRQTSRTSRTGNLLAPSNSSTYGGAWIKHKYLNKSIIIQYIL